MSASGKVTKSERIKFVLAYFAIVMMSLYRTHKSAVAKLMSPHTPPHKMTGDFSRILNARRTETCFVQEVTRCKCLYRTFVRRSDFEDIGGPLLLADRGRTKPRTPR
jgi:uncharacterized protein (UPF0305 family)